MSLVLRQSTAKVISFGPFLDMDDGKTVEIGMVGAIDHATTGIKLSKNGGALAVRNGAPTTASTYDSYGCYLVTLDATDTGTVGTLRVMFADGAGAPTTSLPVWMDFQVVETAIFDSLYADGVLSPAAQVWRHATTADFQVASSIGKSLYVANLAPGDNGGFLINGTNSGTVTLGALAVSGTTILTGAVTLDSTLTVNGTTTLSDVGANDISLTSLVVSTLTTLTGHVLLSDGLAIAAPSTLNRAGLSIAGNGTGTGFSVIGGGTGKGMTVEGGGTSGVGLSVTTTSGDAISILPAAGNAVVATGNGTSKHGIVATGGTAGTSDGMSLVAGTGGVGLRLASETTTGVTVRTGNVSYADGITLSAPSTLNRPALSLIGNGTGAGFKIAGGSTGKGIEITTTAADGLSILPTNGHAIVATGQGTTKHGISASGGATSSAGISAAGGGTGAGLKIAAGSTGVGVDITTTAGNGLSITPTAGSAIVATGNGTSKHGIIATGGTAGTSDGMTLVAGTGGVALRAATITGSISGGITTVGSVTGNVDGNVSGSVGSVTGNVGGSVGSVSGLTAATVHSDLDDIQARLPAALSPNGNMKSNVEEIDDSTTAAANLRLGAQALETEAVVADAGNSTTQFKTGLSAAVNDHYNGRTIIFTSGTLADQAVTIQDYDGTTKIVTVTAMTSIPVTGVTFVVT